MICTALRYDEPMVSDDFLAFGHYLKWANIKLIGMLEPVPVEHWTEEMGGSFEASTGHGKPPLLGSRCLVGSSGRTATE